MRFIIEATGEYPYPENLDTAAPQGTTLATAICAEILAHMKAYGFQHAQVTVRQDPDYATTD